MTTRKRHKCSEILRLAAKFIHKYNYSDASNYPGLTGGCRAIYFVCCDLYAPDYKLDEMSDKCTEYFKLLKPDNKLLYWFGECTPENRFVRTIALCLAADIAESEGN